MEKPDVDSSVDGLIRRQKGEMSGSRERETERGRYITWNACASQGSISLSKIRSDRVCFSEAIVSKKEPNDTDAEALNKRPLNCFKNNWS